MAGITYERPGLHDSTHDGKELINSKRLGFTLYIGLTVMLFAGLFGGWFVLRGTNEEWPPANVPEMTFLKALPMTIALLLCVVFMKLARKRSDLADYPAFRMYVLYSLLASLLFLLAFGLEWGRLIGAGIDMSGVYGGMYYVITGAFIAHFIGGVYAQIHFLRPKATVQLLLEKNAGFANSQSWYYLMLGLWSVILWLVYLG
ncbi:MAG TPA: hypothetical protein VIX80_02640 [Candidatus Kapabacteria bacterium]